MSRYLIILEPTEAGLSAYSPDLPGCVATGRTLAEVGANMRDAILFHLARLREDGEPFRVQFVDAARIDPDFHRLISTDLRLIREGEGL